MWLRFVLALVLLGYASPAFADGKRDLDDGIAFYENLDTDRAIYRLKVASEAKDLGPKDRAKAYLYLGMVHFENGERAPAESAWKNAFVLDRAIAVPDGTSPKTIEAIEAARSANAAPKGRETDEPGGAKTMTGTDPGGARTQSKDDPKTQTLPAAHEKTGEEQKNTELTTATTPAHEDDDSSLATWLIVGGVVAALAGAAVVTVLLVSGGGDCKEGGGCLTVTFE